LTYSLHLEATYSIIVPLSIQTIIRYASLFRPQQSTSLLLRGYICSSADSTGMEFGDLDSAAQPILLSHANYFFLKQEFSIIY